MSYDFEHLVVARFESIEAAIKRNHESSKEINKGQFRELRNRLGGLEKQARVTNARVTTLETSEATEAAVKNALREVAEIHAAAVDRKVAIGNLFANRWMAVAAILGVVLAVAASSVGWAEIFIHHVK